MGEINEAMLTKIAELLDAKLKPINDKLANFDEFKEDFNQFKLDYNTKSTQQDEEIAHIRNNTADVADKLNEHSKEQARINLLKEYYDKRYNLVILGISDTQDYEKKTQTLHLARNALRDVLNYPNWDSVIIRDAHRLPQVKKQQTTGVQTRRSVIESPRPIIIRLCSVLDKAEIFDCVRNITEYNSSITNENERVYISDHLPKVMGAQKKALLPKAKRAKELKKKVNWRVDFRTADFCLYVDGSRVY